MGLHGVSPDSSAQITPIGPSPVGELFLGPGGQFGGSGLGFSGPQFGVSGTGFGSLGPTAYAGIVSESVAVVEFRPASGEARPIRLFEGPSIIGARYFVLWPPTGTGTGANLNSLRSAGVRGSKSHHLHESGPFLSRRHRPSPVERRLRSGRVPAGAATACLNTSARTDPPTSPGQ